MRCRPGRPGGQGEANAGRDPPRQRPAATNCSNAHGLDQKEFDARIRQGRAHGLSPTLTLNLALNLRTGHPPVRPADRLSPTPTLNLALNPLPNLNLPLNLS